MVVKARTVGKLGACTHTHTLGCLHSLYHYALGHTGYSPLNSNMTSDVGVVGFTCSGLYQDDLNATWPNSHLKETQQEQQSSESTSSHKPFLSSALLPRCVALEKGQMERQLARKCPPPPLLPWEPWLEQATRSISVGWRTKA